MRAHAGTCLMLCIPTLFSQTSARLAGEPGPLVDVGASIYRGVHDTTTCLNTFMGIRYAEPPVGQLRWQRPRDPVNNLSNPVPAHSWPPSCPQARKAPLEIDVCPNLTNATTLPASCRDSNFFQTLVEGDEGCLFLNVWAPFNAYRLPVFVFIHGGGGGFGNGRQDLSPLLNVNNNSFIGITIQYRIGAFGFLAGDEVHRFGTVNAGLYCQEFALEWIQKHIEKFGGDPRRVTIAGQSVGAGPVLLHGAARGGRTGNTLFSQGIAASPFIPTQWRYNDYIPTQSYFSFASKVGCFDGTPFGNQSQTVFDCLVGKETFLLQQASATVDGTGRFGTWGMQSVTDDEFVTERPSQLTSRSRLNGERILIGANADEGFKFMLQYINTEKDLIDGFVSYSYFSQMTT